MSTTTAIPVIDDGAALDAPVVAPTFAPRAEPSTVSVTSPPKRAASSPGVASALGARPRRRSHLRPRLIAAGVVLVVVAGVAYVLRPNPIAVDLAAPTVATMRVTVDADAVTRVRDHYTVAAPVGGLVHRLTLHEGDDVRAGDVLASITTPPAHETERRATLARVDAVRAALLQADTRLAQASQALAQAVRDDGRARALLEAGAIAERDVELAALTVTNRRTELGATQAQRQAARSELVQANAALDAAMGTNGATTLVRAPAAGRVLNIPERSARVIAAGTPLVSVGDPATLEVAADVLSSDAASVRAGQAVEMRGWGGAPLRGVVRLVEPSARTRVSALGVEEQRLTVVIDVPDAPRTLGDGYRLDAGIAVWEGRNVLTVPAGALLRTDAGWEAFVARGGRAERVPVRIGHVGSGVAEVLSGLRRGDSVVVFPPDALRGGARVRSSS